jgi:prophage regulatory protein
MLTRPLLKMPATLQLVQLSRSQLNRLIATGAFPAPVRLSKRAIAFRAEDIEAWLQSRPSARSAMGGAL